MEKYQFHGNCIFKDIADTELTAGADAALCTFGLHGSGLTIKDWKTLSLTYAGKTDSDLPNNVWSCKDQKSASDADFAGVADDTEAADKQNCRINTGKSNTEFDGGKADLVGHFMTEMDPANFASGTDAGEDNKLENKGSY